MKEGEHQSGGVVPRLVGAKAEDRGHVWARVGEAAGEAFSDPVVVRPGASEEPQPRPVPA